MASKRHKPEEIVAKLRQVGQFLQRLLLVGDAQVGDYAARRGADRRYQGNLMTIVGRCR